MLTQYDKVEILFNGEYNLNGYKIPSRRLEFENCELHINGEYIIITTEKIDESTNTTIKTNKVFKLNQILAYKTYKL